MDGSGFLIGAAGAPAALTEADGGGAPPLAARLVALLTSRDVTARAEGYRLFEAAIADALVCSCLDYRALVGGAAPPLLDVIRQSVEAWAASRPADGAAGPAPGKPRETF